MKKKSLFVSFILLTTYTFTVSAEMPNPATWYCNPTWELDCLGRCTAADLNVFPTDPISTHENYYRFGSQTVWGQKLFKKCACASKTTGLRAGKVLDLCRVSAQCEDGSFANAYGECGTDGSESWPQPNFVVNDDSNVPPMEKENADWTFSISLPDWLDNLVIQRVPSGDPAVPDSITVYPPYVEQQ